MKKADFHYDLPSLISREYLDKEATMFPFAVGNIYSFTLSDNLFHNKTSVIDGIPCTWTEAITDDRVGISVRQLTRRNNGLVLTGKTINERLSSLIDLFDDEGHLSLKVSKVVERKWIGENGKETTSRYLKFEKM